MSIVVIKDKCKGCTKCVKGCPFDAITMVDKIAVIGDKCTLCGQCVEVCPFDAIEKTAEEKVVKDISAYKDVWVFAEQRENKLMPVVIELLGEGKKLADEVGNKLCAILLGSNVDALANELVSYGADKVYVCDSPLLKDFTTDAYTKVISDTINEYKPEIVLIGATHIGRDLAPRVAARVDTGLTADCTKLEIDPEDKKIRQTRPAFGGNLMATILCPDNRPQIGTVRPGVFKKPAADEARTAEIVKEDIHVAASEIRTALLEVIHEAAGELVDLEGAEIIVSGGRGVGGPEGFKPIKELAEVLGATVGASRAAVDAGWIGHSHQVGQTGKTVGPKLYIACGISGAIQHVAGMSSSKTIIAINKDETAPIFNVADYAIVGDLFEILPILTAEIKKLKA